MAHYPKNFFWCLLSRHYLNGHMKTIPDKIVNNTKNLLQDELFNELCGDY